MKKQLYKKKNRPPKVEPIKVSGARYISDNICWRAFDLKAIRNYKLLSIHKKTCKICHSQSLL